MNVRRHGSLKETAAAELLAELHRERAFGELHCKNGDREKTVFLKNGLPIFVKSNSIDKVLGRILVRKNVISAADYEKSLEEMQATGRLHGSVLMEMGCITTKQLKCALQCQLWYRLIDLFEWEDGRYLFRSRRSFPPVSVVLNRTTAAIIFEGVKQTHSLERLLRLLGPYLDHYIHLHLDRLLCFPDLDLREEEKRFLLQLRSDCTLRQAAVLGLGEEAVYRLIYTLKCAGIVVFATAPPSWSGT